jgi:hypothetical protein
MAHNVRTYIPCLPTRAMKDPSGEQWVHEVKHDGYLLMARKVDGPVHQLIAEAPQIASDLSRARRRGHVLH